MSVHSVHYGFTDATGAPLVFVVFSNRTGEYMYPREAMHRLTSN